MYHLAGIEYSTSYTNWYVVSRQTNSRCFKTNFKIVPLSGQTTASNGQKIIVSLPPKSSVDLSTFEMNFIGATQHRGNNVATNVGNLFKTLIFHALHHH